MEHAFPMRRAFVAANFPGERDTPGNRIGIPEDRLQFLHACILQRNLGADETLRRDRPSVQTDLRVEIHLRSPLLQQPMLRCELMQRCLDVSRQPIPAHVVECGMADASRGYLKIREFNFPCQRRLSQASAQPPGEAPVPSQVERNLLCTAETAEEAL